MNQETSHLEQVIENIKNIIKTNVLEINYIDEDWGQLDFYAPNFPVNWPCVLISIDHVQYSDIGKDIRLKPHNRQLGVFSITIKVAKEKLTNSNVMTSRFQKDKSNGIFNLIEKLHKCLHGTKAHNTGVLSRESLLKVKRDDGVQEYSLTYKLSLTNV